MLTPSPEVFCVSLVDVVVIAVQLGIFWSELWIFVAAIAGSQHALLDHLRGHRLQVSGETLKAMLRLAKFNDQHLCNPYPTMLQDQWRALKSWTSKTDARMFGNPILNWKHFRMNHATELVREVISLFYWTDQRRNKSVSCGMRWRIKNWLSWRKNLQPKCAWIEKRFPCFCARQSLWLKSPSHVGVWIEFGH